LTNVPFRLLRSSMKKSLPFDSTLAWRRDTLLCGNATSLPTSLPMKVSDPETE